MKVVLEAGRWVVDLKPSGIARIAVAGFLLFWLAGWAAGEAFAVSMLLELLRAARAAGAEGASAWKAAGGSTGGLTALGFIALWLALWTLGGLFAMYHALRALIGAERLEWDASGITRITSVGPLRSIRRIERDALRGIWERGRTLLAESRDGPVTLATGCTREERAELAAELRRTLGLHAIEAAVAGAQASEVPPGWETEVDPAGFTVLRRRGWLILGTRELRLKNGYAELRTRLPGRTWTRVFDNADVAIEHWTDEDQDHCYRLVLRGVTSKQELAQAIDDPEPVLHLGRWIARRLERPLELPRELRSRQAA